MPKANRAATRRVRQLMKQQDLTYQQALVKTRNQRQEALQAALQESQASRLRFPMSKTSLRQSIDDGVITVELAADIKRWVKEGKNIVIAGYTCSGKSTLLNGIINSTLRDETERVLVLESEDSPELYLDNVPHCKRTLARGKAMDETPSLIEYTIKRKPDRVIIDTLYGETVMPHTMMALNTGHRGWIMTAHSSSAKAVLSTFCAVTQRNMEYSWQAARQLVYSSCDIVLYIEKSGRGDDRRYQVTEVAQSKVIDEKDFSVKPLYEMEGGQLMRVGEYEEKVYVEPRFVSYKERQE